MKLKIKVKRIPHLSDNGENYLVPLPEVIDKGDYIDLRAAETIDIKGPVCNPLDRSTKERKVIFSNIVKVPLGVAIKLPNGYFAQTVSRSSTPSKYSIICSNSEAIIDGGPMGYNGNNDEWKFLPLAFNDCHIERGDRICQFSVVLSQKATVWQRIKNLFYNGVEIVEVDDLESEDRGGIGTTGVN